MSDTQSTLSAAWNYLVEHAASLAATIVSFFALRRVKELHVLVNSRLTELLKASGQVQRAEGKAEGQSELLKATGQAERAEGKAEGQAAERQRTDEKAGGQP